MNRGLLRFIAFFLIIGIAYCIHPSFGGLSLIIITITLLTILILSET